MANNTSGSGYVRSVGSAYGSRGSLAGESGGWGSVGAGSKGEGSVGDHRFFLGDINENDCDGIGNIVRSQTAGGFNSQTSHNFGSFEVSLDMFSWSSFGNAPEMFNFLIRVGAIMDKIIFVGQLIKIFFLLVNRYFFFSF